jgi:hypothetical protein
MTNPLPLSLLLLAGLSPLAHAGQTKVATVVQPFALHGVNAAKFAYGPSGVRVVFTTPAGVYYSASASGTNPWSTPLLLASGANRPAIAITQNGMVAVTYHLANNIYYRYFNKHTWSPPVLLAGGDEVAIAAFRNEIHVAYTGYGTRWAKFPVTNPQSITVNAESVVGVPLCGSSVSAKPAIAVIPSAPGSKIPLVLVGFQFNWSGTTACGTGVQLFTVYRRLAANSWQSAGLGLGGPGAVSISLAGNPQTGDCYSAISSVQGATSETILATRNLWTNGPSRILTLLPRRAIVSIAAFNSTAPRIRIAVSDFTQGSDGYGPAWHRSGTWTHSDAAPNWDGPAVTLSANARDVQALASEVLTVDPKSRVICKGDLTRRYAWIDQKLTPTSFDLLLDSDVIGVTIPCTATGGGGANSQ